MMKLPLFGESTTGEATPSTPPREDLFNEV